MNNHPDDGMGRGAGLTPEEAKEFHKVFVSSFILFTIIAIIAHFLVWMWRPWGLDRDMAMVGDATQLAANTITTFLG